MEASIARLASGERIRAAADKGGMVTPAAGEVHYLRVRGAADGRLAARRMRAPSDDAQALMANHGVVPGSLMAPVTPAVPATDRAHRRRHTGRDPGGHTGRDAGGARRDAGADAGRDGAADHRHAGGNDSPHRLTACG